jgi:UDP-glucose 4-epimerase
MRILITGIGGRLAQLIAMTLAAQPAAQVIGLGPAAQDLERVEVISQTPRGQALAELLRDRAPDVVLDLDQPGEELPGAARARQLQTIDLLGACLASGIRRVVLRSSTLVYGAAPQTPALLREEAGLHVAESPGLQADYIAVEQFASACAARDTPTTIAILRCAAIVGRGISSPLARYLSQPRPLTLLGFNPRIQVLHADDAAVAFGLAALGTASGAFNIAADDTLTLDQAIRLAGRSPLPLPSAAFSQARLTALLTAPARQTLPFDPALLQFSCVADTCRARSELGWLAQHSAADSVSALAQRQ